MKHSHSFFTALFLLLGLVALLAAACGDDPIEVVSGAVTSDDADTASDAVYAQDPDDSGTDTSIDNGDQGFDGTPTPTPDLSDVPPLPDDAQESDDMDHSDDAPAVSPPADEMPLLDSDEMRAVVVDDFGMEWLVVPQRNDLSDAKSHPILDVVVMDDTHLGVRFEAIAEGCSGAEAYADESDTEVRVELFVGLPPEAAATTCMMMQVQKQIVIELAAPLGNRELVITGNAAIDDVAAVTPETSLEDYIGLFGQDALAKAEISGRPARVVKVNGEFLITTDDYVPARLNLEVVDGIVTGLKTDAGEEAGDYSGF